MHPQGDPGQRLRARAHRHRLQEQGRAAAARRRHRLHASSRAEKRPMPPPAIFGPRHRRPWPGWPRRRQGWPSSSSVQGWPSSSSVGARLGHRRARAGWGVGLPRRMPPRMPSSALRSCRSSTRAPLCPRSSLPSRLTAPAHPPHPRRPAPTDVDAIGGTLLDGETKTSNPNPNPNQARRRPLTLALALALTPNQARRRPRARRRTTSPCRRSPSRS